MNENKKKLLEITLVLVSDDTFDVEIYEPKTGEFSIVKCDDNGDFVESQNNEIAAEIRYYINQMRNSD